MITLPEMVVFNLPEEAPITTDASALVADCAACPPMATKSLGTVADNSEFVPSAVFAHPVVVAAIADLPKAMF